MSLIEKIRSLNPLKPLQNGMIRGVQSVVLSLLAPGNKNQFIGGTQKFFGSGAGNESLDMLRRITGWVFVCLSINGQACASVPGRLYSVAGRRSNRAWDTVPVRRETLCGMRERPWIDAHTRGLLDRAVIDGQEVEEVTGEHPWNRIVRSPNPILEWFDIVELTSIWRDATGDAFWYLAQDGLGIPRELWPLQPHRMRLVSEPGKPIAGWVYSASSDDVIFPEEAQPGLIVGTSSVGENKKMLTPEEVVHFRRVHPMNPYGRGLSAIHAGQLSIDTLVMMEEYTRKLIEGDGTPPFILSTDQRMADGWASEVIKSWLEQRRLHGGDVPGILQGGLKPTVIGLSPREMAYERGQEAMLRETAAIFDIPWDMVAGKNTGRETSLTADQRHRRGAIAPRLARIDSEINASIIWPFFGNKFFYLHDNCVPEDEEAQATRLTRFVQGGIITSDEARIEIKYPPLGKDGSDELWMQGATQPMKLLSKGGTEGVKPFKAPVGVHPDAGNGVKADGGAGYDRAGAVRLEADPYHPRPEQLEVIDRFLAERYRAVGRMLETVDLAGLRSLAREQQEDIDESDVGIGEDEELFDEETRRKFHAAMLPFVLYWIERGIQEGKRRIHIDLETLVLPEFDLSRPEAQGAKDAHLAHLQNVIWPGLEASTIRAVRKMVQRGIAAGQSREQIIASVMGFLEEKRIERMWNIARDQNRHAEGVGVLIAYAAAGLREHQWIAKDGACPDCAQNHGQIVAVGEPFLSGDTAEPVHGHCRCKTHPVKRRIETTA